MAYLYRHIRLDKNEPFYIGIGSDINYNRAFSLKNRNKYWKNIISKTEWLVEIILDDLTWEQACKKEKEFINIYGRKDFNLGTLCNMTDGGDGAFNPSLETRIKLSESKKGKKNPIFNKPRTENWYKAMEKFKGKGNPNYGKTIPDYQKEILRKAQLGRIKSIEEKKILSLKNKGKKRTKDFCKKMSDINKNKIRVFDSNTGIFYDSITQAASILGINRRTLNAKLLGIINNNTSLKKL